MMFIRYRSNGKSKCYIAVNVRNGKLSNNMLNLSMKHVTINKVTCSRFCL